MKSTNRSIISTETTEFQGLPIAAAGVRIEDHQMFVTVGCDEIEAEINNRVEAAAKARDDANEATRESLDAIQEALKPIEAALQTEAVTLFDRFLEGVSAEGELEKHCGRTVTVTVSLNHAGGQCSFPATMRITNPGATGGYNSADSIKIAIQPVSPTHPTLKPLIADYAVKHAAEMKARGVFNHFMTQKGKMPTFRKQSLAAAMKANLLAQPGGVELMERITKSVREVADKMAITGEKAAIAG